MAKTRTTLVEARLYPVLWCSIERFEALACAHDILDMLGVIFPVGRDMQDAVRYQLVGDEAYEIRLHDPAFMVTLFMPGIGKEQVNSRQRCVGNIQSQHFDRITPDNLEVGEFEPVRFDASASPFP